MALDEIMTARALVAGSTNSAGRGSVIMTFSRKKYVFRWVS
jgi:hypothetical protein